MSMPSTLAIVPFNISDYAKRQAAKATSYGIPPGREKRVGLLEIERLSSHLLPPIPSDHEIRTELNEWKPSFSVYRILRTSALTDDDRFRYQQATSPPVPDEKLEEYHTRMTVQQKVGYILSIIGLQRRKPSNLEETESTAMIRKRLLPSDAELVVDPTTNSITLKNPPPGTLLSPFQAFNTKVDMPNIPAEIKYHPTILEAKKRWASKVEELESNDMKGDQEKASQSKVAVNKASREVALAARALYSPETQAKINRRTGTVLAKMVKNYPAKKRAKRGNRLEASPLA